MRWLLVPCLIVLLVLGAAGCGASGGAGSTNHTPSTAATGVESSSGYAKADRDKDNDFSYADDTNNDEILDYAQPAGPADARSITALIKRYYAIAVAGDGAKACSMLYVTLAEAAVEDYGYGSAGPAYLTQGRSCPGVLDLMFKHFHNQLVAELSSLKVTRVRLKHHHGLAVLSFGTMPERQINVRRERHTWKLEALLDSALPR